MAALNGGVRLLYGVMECSHFISTVNIYTHVYKLYKRTKSESKQKKSVKEAKQRGTR